MLLCDVHTILVFFSVPNVETLLQYSYRDPLTRASNAGGVGKITILDGYLAIGWMTAGVRSTIATVDREVYCTDRHASVNRFMDDHDEEKRTEQKSEAEVTNNIEEDCARRIVLLKLTTDRHEASRGLSDERVEIRHYNVRNVCNGRGVSVSICTLHT